MLSGVVYYVVQSPKCSVELPRQKERQIERDFDFITTAFMVYQDTLNEKKHGLKRL